MFADQKMSQFFYYLILIMQDVKLICINKYFVLIFAIKILNIYRIYILKFIN